MTCQSCGAAVRPEDRFCNACGVRLTAAAEPDEAEPDEPGEPGEPGADELDEHRAGSPDRDEDEPDEDVTRGDAPDQRSVAAAPMPPPAPFAPATSPLPPPAATRPESDVTRQLAAMAGDPTPPPRPAVPEAAPASDAATTRLPSGSGGEHAGATSRMGVVPAHDTTVASTGRGPAVATSTGQVPASYTPMPVAGYEPDRPVFRLGIFVFVAIATAGLAAATTLTDIVSVETTSGVPGFSIGTWKINDLGTNNTVAAFLAAGLVLLGGILACWRSQLGAGLAGGAGLALAGWSALVLGLAEIPLASASTAISNDTTGQLAGSLTRDVGYWLLVAAGGAGVLVFLVSLTLLRRSVTERGLNPWIAALGAAATLVAVAGPLLPRNEAELEQNWSSPPGLDLPTLFFAGRAAQLGVLAFCGVVGFLLVRRYGLGIAIGGYSIVSWLAVTSLLELSASPIGPAVANPGADNFPFPVPAEAGDLMPHAATVGGIAVALVCALIGLVEAAVTFRRGD